MTGGGGGGSYRARDVNLKGERSRGSPLGDWFISQGAGEHSTPHQGNVRMGENP